MSKKAADVQAATDIFDPTEVVEFTLKRVMKNLNNFILNEYKVLFPHLQEKGKDTVKADEFIGNDRLVAKAQEDLKFCQDKSVTPTELIKKCINELEAMGFLYMVNNDDSKSHLIHIKDQQKQLRDYIYQELEEATGKQRAQGLNFDMIYKRVKSNFQNFYTKDVVFKSIDDLFQQG